MILPFLDLSSLSNLNMYPSFIMQALNANGLFFKKYEIQVFQKAYGENGKINWFRFLSHLREPMGPIRKQLV